MKSEIELKHFSLKDIKGFERFFRANLINSITGYKPANLIGAVSAKGDSNLAIFTSVVHLGANPPLLGFIQRPVGEFSHTYKNIKETGYFTVNHVHAEFAEKAHLTSAKYKAGVSEFEKCGLKEERLDGFIAPFVKESKIKMGLKFVKEMPIDLNDTVLMIGQIEHLFVDTVALPENGDLDLSAVNDICVSGLYTYNSVEKINTFPYAKNLD